MSAAQSKRTITLIPGDGIGPECINAARKIIDASGVNIEWEERQAGTSVFKQGIQSGVPQDTIDSIRKTRVVLKGPLATPVGFGEKSANVTLRKLFETYANIRPVRELPNVPTPYSGRKVDIVVVRENVEDLYAGIEHMQTPGVAQCLKVISTKGSEKVARLAFEFARSSGRKKIHCATKSNIMKLTEGTFKRAFEKVAPEYPDIEASHIIIDNCAHQLVKKPEQFDIILTTNMNGDIISDLSSALVGGLGFAPSANIGTDVAIFEAVHGSAPKYAGQNVINPLAVIMSAIYMLRHIEEFDAATKIEQAIYATLEEGKVRTGDVIGYDKGCKTTELTDAIIGNLGKKSKSYNPPPFKAIKLPKISSAPDFVKVKTRRVAGIDLFLESPLNPDEIGKSVEQLIADLPVKLKIISNRGTKVYPASGSITDCVDAFYCRIILNDKNASLEDDLLLNVLKKVATKHRWTHIEKLNEFDGALGYTKAQGED